MGTLYDSGKSHLFNLGWTSGINKIYLYTSGNVLVDSQSVTFTYSGGVLVPTADIVFNVPAGTSNVAYVEIGRYTPEDPPIPAIFNPYYKEGFSTTYNFTTAGTLTIDSWELNIGGTGLQAAGEEALFTTGWASTITQAKLYTVGDALVDTQSITFEVNGSYQLVPTAAVTFDVAGSTNDVKYINLCDASNNVYFKRLFSGDYDFPTAGTLLVSSWPFSVA